MSILYVPIGISGSGKTTVGNKIREAFSGVVVVCPDDERKRLTGNVSDQSRNDEVFSNCYGLVGKYLRQGTDVFFSATNLSGKDRKTLLKIAKSAGSFITAIVLMDSLDPGLCLSRVRKDLASGVDRSNTTVINDETKETVVDRQFKKFKDNYQAIEGYDALIEYRSTDSISWKDELEPIVKLARN